MSNDAFLAKCKSINPSAEVDRKKNLEAIQNRLKEEEQSALLRNKKIRRPVVAAALLAGILSLSVVAYAAAPMIWRHFDAGVVRGEEYVNELIVAEIDLPDGTTSDVIDINIDHERLEGAGGEPIILEVDGEEWVYLDELNFDSIEDGLALLQLENIALPTYLPDGFSFSRFTFPVNPNNHQYRLGVIPSDEIAYVFFSNGNDTILLQLSNLGTSRRAPSIERGQQGVRINGNEAVLSGSLSANEYSRLERTVLTHGTNDGISGDRDFPFLTMMIGDTAHSLQAMSENTVTLYDLVKMAESMK